MKRYNHLFEACSTFSNLYFAYQRAYRGSPHTSEAHKFSFHLERELFQLQQELREGSYRPGGFRHYTIHDPKKRLISVAPFRDRVIHHAVVHILEPIYEPCFIYDSYATRKEKGTHKAILRVQEFLRTNHFYLKTDIQKHFESMSHEVLMKLLRRKIKDSRFLQLIEVILKGVPWKKGLPIGNLTSQFLANVYLNPLDHLIKDHLGFKFYVRYMDDMVFLSNDMKELQSMLRHLEHFLETELELTLKAHAVYFNQRSNGISFLGARIFPNHLRIKNSSFQRGLKKLEQKQRMYEHGQCTEETLTASYSSVLGHLEFFNTYRLRCSLGQASSFWREPCQTGWFVEQQPEELALC